MTVPPDAVAGTTWFPCRLGYTIALTLSLLVATAGCRSAPDDDGRTRVTAGFARLGELAERIGGDRVRVTDLTPPGAEPHDLELSSKDIDAVDDAALVLYLGGGFQPGLAEAARRAGRALDLLKREERKDPHIWLDPVRYGEAAAAVEEALVAADPAAAAGYKVRGAAFRNELAALDDEMQAGLAVCQRREIVTAHDAFGHLARRYQLEQEPITGISPEAEPDPARLADLADLVREKGVTTVFTERLVSPRVAEALAREAGVAVAVLDPLEGRLEGGYVGAMRRNLTILRTALGCS